MRSGVGARRARRGQSGYVVEIYSPTHPCGERLLRTGRLALVVERLRVLRAQVKRGANIAERIADGQLVSWYAREPLSVAAGINIIAWDRADRPPRTTAERVALLDKALSLLGAL